MFFLQALQCLQGHFICIHAASLTGLLTSLVSIPETLTYTIASKDLFAFVLSVSGLQLAHL